MKSVQSTNTTTSTTATHITPSDTTTKQVSIHVDKKEFIHSTQKQRVAMC